MDEGKRTADEERESYRDGYERDAAGWRTRITELKDSGASEKVIADAEAALDNALAELARLDASKRPRKARESR